MRRGTNQLWRWVSIGYAIAAVVGWGLFGTSALLVAIGIPVALVAIFFMGAVRDGGFGESEEDDFDRMRRDRTRRRRRRRDATSQGPPSTRPF